MKFQNEKNFYLINKMSDLDEDNLIKYKEKKDNNGILNKDEEKKEEEKQNKGKVRKREFAIFDSNNRIHIVNADNFEHFSDEYIPIQ